MHDFTEAMQIYAEEKAKTPNYDTILVSEWRELMPEQFTRKMLKKKYGCHLIDIGTYNEAVSLFDWVEDKGHGAKWSVDDIKRVSGIDFDTKDYTVLDFSYVMNMFWSDNCNVFTDSGYYIKMAKNYLEDPDYMGNSSERAYHDAIKRINYFTE